MPGPRDATRGHADRPPWGFAVVVGAYLAGTVVAILLVSASGAGTNSPLALTLGTVGLWAGFVGVPAYLSRTYGTGRLATDFGLRLGGPADVGLGLASGLASWGVVDGYARLLKTLGDHADLGHEATQMSGHGLGATFVLFGFAHLGSEPIEAVLPLAMFGAVLGVLAWRTGRLGPGIVAHMTFNGATVVALALSR